MGEREKLMNQEGMIWLEQELLKKRMATAVAAKVINLLGVDLLTMATTPGENALLSPYSIQSVLAMVYAGAEGETGAEMQRVLHYLADKDELHDGFAALQTALETMVVDVQVEEELNGSRRGRELPFILETANRLYGQAGFEFQPAFLSLLREKYGTTLEAFDFKSNPTAAARSINDWVSERTHGKISQLIAPEMLNEATRLVLVNAIYLKAKWACEFAEAQTRPLPFHVHGGRVEKVPTMVLQTSFGYRSQDGFCAVSLPYIGNEVQLLILLPDRPDGLAELEKKCSAELLGRCADLPAMEIKLFLPKYELETPVYDLNQVMIDFGVRQAFDEPVGTANLNGIAPRKGDEYLAVTSLLHKAYLKVDEQGTEAAAVTMANMVITGIELAPTDPILVKVDRPFLFAIQHRPSGACLFMGRVVDPR